MSANPTVILSTEEPSPALEVFREAYPELMVHSSNSYEALPRLIAETGAEIVFTVKFAGAATFPREALLNAPSVKWISVGGSGTDHLRPWDPARITVTNAAGVAADMMAEYALGVMLSFSLDFGGFRAKQQARDWDKAGKVEPIEGTTVLLLGLGETGKAVARRAKAMGLKVLGVRARPQPTANVDEVHGIEALPQLWGRADFIICAVPLLESTRGLVGAEAFAAMRPHCVLIDVSRGGVVKEAALTEALYADRIKGAALDVFATEPLPPDNPLWGFGNVIVTPHCSSVYDGWELRAARMFAENLARYRRGDPLMRVVDPQRGY